MADVILDTLLDCLKLLPFLFITYLVLEFIEHRTKDSLPALISKSRRLMPIVGSALGIVPQCGFSASASGLYAQRVITAGTLLAVFLSTSDEMLPVLISESVGFGTIWKILLVKFCAGCFFGILIDLIFKQKHDDNVSDDICEMCHDSNCHCEERGIVISAAIHTLQIIGFILIITFALNLLIYFIGEDVLSNLILNRPVIGPIIAALVGLIPNCAASVVITELFVSGAMSTGAMLAGLLAASGVGVLVLFRVNRSRLRENLMILVGLYLSGVLTGIIFDALGIVI